MSAHPIGRRSFLALTVGTALGTALAGCTAPAGGRTTVRFYQQKQEVIGYFDGLLRDFEAEHPGVVAVHDTTNEIAPQFVRGEPADVGCFNDNLELARYISRGQMSDLSHLPSAATVRTDIGDLTDQYATYPGRTSVLPYSLAAAGVIYNRGIFDRYRLPVPATWSEFVDVCTALRAAGVTPIYAGTFVPPSIPLGNYLQSAIGTGDFEGMLRRLDADWRRLAGRGATS